jgi:imidazoleglycerol-phosphate dehydratase
MDLNITAKGDLEIDGHHTVEDVGWVLGQALYEGAGRTARHRTIRLRLCAPR